MRRGQGAAGVWVSLCPQGVSQPDLEVGWHGHGVVKAGGSELVPIRIVGVGLACGEAYFCIQPVFPKPRLPSSPVPDTEILKTAS